VELVLREKKAGKLGGKKNWYAIFFIHYFEMYFLLLLLFLT